MPEHDKYAAWRRFAHEKRASLVKAAALNSDVELRPHQKAALETLDRSGGRALFAHGTGTGKTLTSIAAFERLREQGKAKRALDALEDSPTDLRRTASLT